MVAWIALLRQAPILITPPRAGEIPGEQTRCRCHSLGFLIAAEPMHGLRVLHGRLPVAALQTAPRLGQRPPSLFLQREQQRQIGLAAPALRPL